MVDEDQRSALMRQALDELEAQYDAVGAFSVTVDACVEIKCRGAISSHGSITTSTPSPRHCSMAWRCWFLTEHATHTG